MDNQSGIKKYRTGLICLAIVILLFSCIGGVMGLPNMLNTIMHTAHDLLLNTVFYLMAICVITGALGRIFVEFGVVSLLERLLRPMMKPLFNLPGVASLGAVMTFLSDNPAIISLAKDKRFSSYFKKFQFISLTNFGTAFGMGLLVIVFMISNGYYMEPFIGLIGAFIGCIVSTRLMQRFILKQYPNFAEEFAAVVDEQSTEEQEQIKETSRFTRILNSLLDGGKTGVDVGLSIIPGVLIISTLVMILTFGPNDAGAYTGAAYEGVSFLPWVAGKVNFLFDWTLGFEDPHLIAFPITALGAVGAALGLIPGFIEQGWVDGNAIAVFTAIGMCWSGYLSTHTAMLDALGYRKLTSKAILAHTIGGLAAAVSAHWIYLIITLIFGASDPKPGFADVPEVTVKIEYVDSNVACVTIEKDGELKAGRVFVDESGDRYTDDNSLANYIYNQLAMHTSIMSKSTGIATAKLTKTHFIFDSDIPDTMFEDVRNEIRRGFNMYKDDMSMIFFERPIDELLDSEKGELNKSLAFDYDRSQVDGTTSYGIVDVTRWEQYKDELSNVKSAAPTSTAPATQSTAATPQQTATATAKTTATTTTTTNSGSAEYYTVDSGDTYTSIAKRHGLTTAELKALNPGVNHDKIDIGDKVRVK